MPLQHLQTSPLESIAWRDAWDQSDLDGRHTIGIEWLRRLLWDRGDNRRPIGDQFVAPKIVENLAWLETILLVVDPHGFLGGDIPNQGFKLADRETLNDLLGSGPKTDGILYRLRALFTAPPSEKKGVLREIAADDSGEMVFFECNDKPRMRQMLNVLAWGTGMAPPSDPADSLAALKVCLGSGINHRYAEAPSPLLGRLQQIHHRVSTSTDALPDQLLLSRPDLLAASIQVAAENWILSTWDEPFCPMDYIGFGNAQSKGVPWDGRPNKPERFSTLLREYARPHGTPADLIANIFPNGEVLVEMARLTGQTPIDVLQQLRCTELQEMSPAMELPSMRL
jgi:hypothetical protein